MVKQIVMSVVNVVFTAFFEFVRLEKIASNDKFETNLTSNVF